MSESARRVELSCSEALANEGEDGWEAAPWTDDLQKASPPRARRDAAASLVRAEAALVAARNEISLLRVRVERLAHENERLRADSRRVEHKKLPGPTH